MDEEKVNKLLDFIHSAEETDNNAEACKLRFEDFKHLWKADDVNWMEQRKDEWRKLAQTICSGCDAKHLNAYKVFFLTGEEIPADVHDIQMNIITRFILTPFLTPEVASGLYTLVSHPNDISFLLAGFMEEACSRAEGMPWLRDRIVNFREGVLGDTYQVIKSSSGRREKIVSPDPTSYCDSFTKYALKLLRMEQSYNFSVDAVPYFISALPYADSPKFRKFIKLQEMMDEVDKIMQAANEYPELVQDLAKQLKEREEEIWENWKTLEHLDQAQ